MPSDLTAARERARHPRSLRACTKHLAAHIKAALYPRYEGQFPMPVEVLAERAGVSVRSIYRIIELDAKPTQTLHLADRVMLALDKPLEELHLVDAEEEDCDCG